MIVYLNSIRHIFGDIELVCDINGTPMVIRNGRPSFVAFKNLIETKFGVVVCNMKMVVDVNGEGYIKINLSEGRSYERGY